MLFDRIGVPVDDLGYDLIVFTPTGDFLTTGVCVSDIVVLIQQCIISTNFFVLDKRKFDSIFGIEWMTRH